MQLLIQPTCLIAVIFLLVFLPSNPCFSASVSLQWDPNSETDLVGYKLYYRAATSDLPFDGADANEGSSPLVLLLSDLSSTAPEKTFTGLDPGLDYYFAVTSYNIDDLESVYSNIVTILESIPPAITINPITSQTILTSQTLTGTVTDNRPGTAVMVSVGSAAPVNVTVPGNWTATVTDLAVGNNTFTITATDAAGNITTAPAVTITRHFAGAVNTDGTIGIADARKSLSFALGLETPTEDQRVRSDVAPVDMTTHQPIPDGKLDIDDVIVMLRRVVGLPW